MSPHLQGRPRIIRLAGHQPKVHPNDPLCNGNTGANSGMGLLTFLVMRPIRNDLNAAQLTSICSREELLRDIADLNSTVEARLADMEPQRPSRSCKRTTVQDLSTIIVGSMDVNALYSSCLLKEASSHIRDALKQGHTWFEQTDIRFILRYLGITFGQTGVQALDKYIPQPKETTTLHSLVTRETQHQFWEAQENPDFMTREEKLLAITNTQPSALQHAIPHTPN